MDIQQGIARLNSLLPLAARQQQLDPELHHLHHLILCNFIG